VLAERYYAVAEQIIRKYDRRGLILGVGIVVLYPEVVRRPRSMWSVFDESECGLGGWEFSEVSAGDDL